MPTTDKATARRRVASGRPSSTIARPSDFIWSFAFLAAQTPGIKVVIYARVSGRAQRTRSLQRQIDYARRVVEAAGGEVVSVFSEVASGWVADPKGRPQLEGAARLAAASGAVIVATTVSRFVRSADFDTRTNQDAVPTDYEMLSIMRLVGGKVDLATILNPDATPSEVRAFESNRGGNRGGRPKTKYAGYKKDVQKAKMPLLLDYFLRSGSKKDAAKRAGVARTTAREWLTRMGVADFSDEDWPEWN